ncbi:MAG: leucine-rich repeat domain-containing protein, partial [Oscillospiraceae bacterium]|nr:leucine-rich repeat domain-containing protein [Oscillospiraceae bacterium]
MAFYVENSGSICRPGRTLVRYEPEDGETEIAIPEGVTRIERKVFQNCENLISVKLPDSVRSVGSWAFEGCKNLREIVLPEQIVYFDDTAVRDYRNLKIRQGDLSFRVTEAFSHFALFRFLEAKDSD